MAKNHYPSILRRKSINMLTSANKKEHLLVAASYRKTPMLESLSNSEYCKIFKSTYFEEHLRMAASENGFMKLRKIKIYS